MPALSAMRARRKKHAWLSEFTVSGSGQAFWTGSQFHEAQELAAWRMDIPAMDTLTGDDFRVLVLLPGERDAPLRCELRTTSLADHPPYEALSYVWSIKPDPARLEVDGQSVAITEGLEHILFRLRHASEPRTLWIDRLCINQSDTTEKSAQVSRMRAIYSNCTRALLWMGELDEDTPLADAEAGVAVLEYIAAHDPGSDSDSDSDSDSNSDAGSNSDTSSHSKASSGPETDPHSDVSSNEAVVPPVPECIKSEESFRAAMAALGRISPRKGPWWKRVWTVQEAMLPPDALFLWGPFSISWDTMAAASEAWIRTCDYEESMTGSQCEMLHDPGHLGDTMAHIIWMGSYDSETGEPPLPTAVKWRGRSATMPVDKVYALTGLNAPGVLPRSEKCDYTLDMRQVYINYTLDLIHRDGDSGDLHPLVIDPRREPDADDDGEGLPRWVVDMRSEPKYDTVPWRQYHFYHRFEANQGLPRDCPPEYDGEALRLSGVAIDTVAEVGDGYYVEVDGIHDYPPVRPILRAWWTQYCRSPLANLAVADEVLYCGLEPGNCDIYDRPRSRGGDPGGPAGRGAAPPQQHGGGGRRAVRPPARLRRPGYQESSVLCHGGRAPGAGALGDGGRGRGLGFWAWAGAVYFASAARRGFQCYYQW
ncbi:hypothetical protein PG991_016020 [Apiospora marii]|uniref:Heterokaryon incompatibility domain-containing protein n=1 Tax=Apiospora marii TaxID=335849 RepID=A0ABR1R0C0_9PEZI